MQAQWIWKNRLDGTRTKSILAPIPTGAFIDLDGSLFEPTPMPGEYQQHT